MVCVELAAIIHWFSAAVSESPQIHGEHVEMLYKCIDVGCPHLRFEEEAVDHEYWGARAFFDEVSDVPINFDLLAFCVLL